MTRQEIMVRAHEIARTMEGDYAARISAGLRQAWFESRLIASGGKVWEKAGHRRIYMNNLDEFYGLEISRYNTGNISSATLDGEHISNSSARQILGMLDVGKLWYDMASGTFASRGLSEEAVDRITTRLMAA